MGSYDKILSFQHLDLQLNIFVLVKECFRNNLTITHDFHQSLEHCRTEFFTMENLDYLMESVASSSIPVVF